MYYSATQQHGEEITLHQAEPSQHPPFQAPEPKATKHEEKVIQITDPMARRDITEEKEECKGTSSSKLIPSHQSSARKTPFGVSMVCICKSNLCMEYMLPPPLPSLLNALEWDVEIASSCRSIHAPHFLCTYNSALDQLSELVTLTYFCWNRI